MEALDYVLKFSSELLVLLFAIVVGALNVYYFAGHAFADQSFAAAFLNNHTSLNSKLYAKNNSIVTTVTQGNLLFPQAQADDIANFGQQATASDDNTNPTLSDAGIVAPNPADLKSMVVNVTKKIYTTLPGDTLKSIAAANGITVNDIRWSNPSLASNDIKPGWSLIIPPTDGVAVTADSNTTLPDLATRYSPQRYNSDAKTRNAAAAQLLDKIIAYNGLDSAEGINPGDFLVIPGGVMATPPPPPAPKTTTKPGKTKSSSGYDGVTSVSGGYDDSTHYFPVGYCTYYVASKMNITFGGNARNWLSNAKASGYVTSSDPAPRSAVVFSGYGYGKYGHVAYVEQVADDKVLIAEMNYEHFNRIDERWISKSDPAIRGYIYP